MIPKTYPSSVISGVTACKVYVVTPGGNDQRWIDYIPVQSVTSSKVNTYDNDGSIAADVLTSASGLQAWVDYIPVYIEGTSKWTTDNTGYIPMEALAGSFVVGFDALDSSGNSYSVSLSVLDSAGASYTVSSTVLGSTGTSYTPI